MEPETRNRTTQEWELDYNKGGNEEKLSLFNKWYQFKLILTWGKNLDIKGKSKFL